MVIGNIFRTISDIIQISWVRTVLFNFSKLSLKQAVHLPILLYHPHLLAKDYLFNAGKVKICSNKVKFGMIKLGKKSQSTCIQTGIWLANRGTLIFKGSALIGNGSKIEIKDNAILEVGNNTGITGDTTINCHAHIILGEFFSCGWNVSITDTDFHECYHIKGKEKTLEPVNSDIHIGNYVWVCSNATILKGSEVPDWCIVASKALVKDKFIAEKYSLIAGIPAKITKSKMQRKDLYELKDKENFFITKGIKVFG